MIVAYGRENCVRWVGPFVMWLLTRGGKTHVAIRVRTTCADIGERFLCGRKSAAAPASPHLERNTHCLRLWRRFVERSARRRCRATAHGHEWGRFTTGLFPGWKRDR